MNPVALRPGAVAWAVLEPVSGRERGGHRPVLVVSSGDYLDAVTTLAIVLPITSVERGWPNHVRADGPCGLDRPSWIVTEQPRTLARQRLTALAGQVTPRCLAEARRWLGDFFDL